MARSIGLKRGTVAIVPYKKSWVQSFQKEKKRLQRTLGSIAVDVQHEGSTSIPGLPAKPLIDILVGVTSLKNGKRIVRIMESSGYHWRPNWGRLDQHILFAKGNEKIRTHYIHVVKHRGSIWKKDLLFRDYLRTNPVQAKRYANLKKRLAKKYPNDRVSYTKKKTEFIQKTLKLAQRFGKS